MQLKQHLIFQQLGDTWIATTVDGDNLEAGIMLTLNKVGYDIVEMLTRDTTPEEIVGRLLDVYDADRQTVAAYVQATIDQLAKAGLIG